MASNPYLDPQRIRAALNGLGVRPNRDLGQNFLLDAGALQSIVAAADIQPHDRVVEVGPGLGVLTHELVQRAADVVSIELDRRLAERLEQEFRSTPLRLVQQDVLRVDPGTLFAGRAPYKVVANLPYQITSAVLRHFLEATSPPELMVVMVQKEVAERVAASPPRMSILAHSVQIYAVPEIAGHVPAASFLPAPRVDSAILRLVRRQEPLVAVDNVDALFRVIKAGFLHARKKLGNALPGGLAAMGMRENKDAVLRALQAAGVDPDRRAETLTLQEWAEVYRRLQDSGTRMPTPAGASAEG